MNSYSTYLHTELFEIDYLKLKDVCASLPIFICEPSFHLKTNELFATEREALWHVVRLLELEGTYAIVGGHDGDSRIIAFSKPKSESYKPFFIDDPDYEIPVYAHEDTEGIYQTDFSVMRALISRSIRSKIAEPLHCEGSTIYDTSIDISPKTGDEKSHELLNLIRVYLGFSFSFRTFGKKAYLQILPKSHIAYSQSYADLLKGGYDKKTLLDNFPYAHVVGQSLKILGMTDKTITDVLDEEPFFGRCFREFSERMYPSLPLEKAAPLIQVASSRITLFPANWAYPSLTYTSISNLDEQYYSALTGRLRGQSKSRPYSALKWIKQISPLSVSDKALELKPVPLVLPYDSRKISTSGFNQVKSLDVGLIFEPPSVSMLRFGNITEIIPGVEKYQATVNDLMTHPELKPIDVPKQINVMVFVHPSLKNGWNTLKTALKEGIGDYRGFAETFGTELVIADEIETDFGAGFLARAHELPIRGYHCSLVVIPRFLETAEETKGIYITAKTEIMSRGIPVQVIADNQTRTLNRDLTLVGKANDARALFGLSINIMAKIGTILCQLSDSVTDHLIPNSLILGYNVGRIVPSNASGLRTIPISAPLVIFDDKGAYVSHQDIYPLRNEVSLFEQHGNRIFQSLPDEVSTLFVHKDGYFYPSELKSLRQKGKDYGIEVNAVSLRTNYVPRVFNPQYFGPGIGLKSGTVLPLSDDDFLMVTTATGRWDPEKMGWPNPVLITIHDVNDKQLKLKILYHIYALTKIHTGSQRAIRTPISIHFSNMIMSFLRKVGDPAPTYIRHFVEKNPQGKYLPRWFL